MADGNHLAVVAIERHRRRLVQKDAAIGLIDEGVNGAEIDGELVLEKLLDKLHGDGSSSRLAGSVQGRVTTSSKWQLVCLNKEQLCAGGCLGSYKESIRGEFQLAYDICAGCERNVRVSRVHNDAGVIVGAALCGRPSCVWFCFGSRAARGVRPYKSFHGVQTFKGVVAEVDTDHAAAALGERAEIAERLRLLEDAEREFLAGDREIRRVIRDDLKEHARVRTAFVKLSGRMQKPRSISDRYRTLRRIAQLRPELLKHFVHFRRLFNVIQERNVIARLNCGQLRS